MKIGIIKYQIKTANIELWNGFQEKYHFTKSSELNIIHLNVRPLTKNNAKIKELMLDLKAKPDIIAISETKLRDHNLKQS